MTNQAPTLLVTGGAGFIGSNFVVHMARTYPNYHILTIDKLTYAGNKDNLAEVHDLANVTFIEGDITDRQLISSLFSEYPIQGVINFAAESHVDRSIEDGTSFVTTNVLGTFTLLQAAKEAWQQEGRLNTHRFHQISTDEVYGSLDSDNHEDKFSEDTPFDPRNPYSATKAGANFIVKSFGYTYDMNVIISSCSNNYGPKQHTEKLIPTIISNALKGRPIPIYGDGGNIRDWIHVEDHCRALDTIYHQGIAMESYNVGGRTEKTNMDVATSICDILDDMRPELPTSTQVGSFKHLITLTEDRLGHDRRYAVDDTKIRETLGWTPQINFEDGLKQTVEWYVNQWLKVTL